MQFIVITGPTYLQAIRRIRKALQIGDGIELRIDCFKTISEKELLEIIALCKKKGKKIILTIRSNAGGGNSNLSNDKLEKYIIFLAKFSPDYLDIEHHLSKNLFRQIKELKVKTIASYHDFVKTPLNLTKLLNSMKKKNSYCYKICTMAENIQDSFRMIQCIHKQKNKNFHFIGICMGEKWRYYKARWNKSR